MIGLRILNRINVMNSNHECNMKFVSFFFRTKIIDDNRLLPLTKLMFHANRVVVYEVIIVSGG